MKEDEHYGVIPGTQKPTLLKPGAEKLCLAFRLDPDYEIIREVREKDFIAYTVKCTLAHIPTSQEIASGIGSCNSKETKYRYRSQNTGKPVPKEYWDKRDSAILGGSQYTVRKKDKQWLIFEQIENENPWDVDNTLIKMACKRALVAATLNATAASDIFTQDIEDMPPEVINAEVVKKAENSTGRGQTSTSVKDEGNSKTPPAEEGQEKTWPSKKVFIADVNSFEEYIGPSQYADILALHEVNPGEIHRLTKEQGLALWKDLDTARRKIVGNRE